MTTRPAQGAKAESPKTWTAFSPGILLIRREVLRLVKHAAEAEAGMIVLLVGWLCYVLHSARESRPEALKPW